MAVAPLFLATMDILKAGLRLSGATSTGALAVIDMATKDVRIGFYQALGATVITAIKVTASSDAPTTDDEIRRALADSTEAKWVRLLLLRRLPTLFLDASAVRQQEWNDTGAFHASPEKRLADEIKTLQAEVDDALEQLKGNVDLDDRTTVRIGTIEPEDTPDLPGATVFPSQRRSSTWDETEGDE